MKRASWIALALAACAVSAPALRQRAAKENPSRRDQAIAALVASKQLTPLDAPTLGAVTEGEVPPGTAIDAPLAQGRLHQQPATADQPAIVTFMEQTCEVGGSCGCELRSEYRYYRAGDRVVVAHLVPDVHTTTITHEGSCTIGCGQPAPPTPAPLRSLGPVAPGAVDVVDVHYRFDRVSETCDKPLPAP